jgi:hypothetical protein
MSRRPPIVTQADVVRAIRAARQAGMSVQRFEIDRDGKITVIAGAVTAPVNELDHELAEFQARHGQD